MQSYPQGAQNMAAAQSIRDRPMNRIESNLEDLNRASESLERSLARLMQHAIALGYFTPEPPASIPSPINGRCSNLHEAVKKIEHQVEVLSSSLNVFD